MLFDAVAKATELKAASEAHHTWAGLLGLLPCNQHVSWETCAWAVTLELVTALKHEPLSETC